MANQSDLSAQERKLLERILQVPTVPAYNKGAHVLVMMGVLMVLGGGVLAFLWGMEIIPFPEVSFFFAVQALGGIAVVAGVASKTQYRLMRIIHYLHECNEERGA